MKKYLCLREGKYGVSIMPTAFKLTRVIRCGYELPCLLFWIPLQGRLCSWTSEFHFLTPIHPISICLLLILLKINNQNSPTPLLKINNQQFFKINNQQFFLLPLFSIRMFWHRTWSFIVEGLLIGNPCHPFLQPGQLYSLLTEIRSSITRINPHRTISFNTWIILRRGFQSWSSSKSPNLIKKSYPSSSKKWWYSTTYQPNKSVRCSCLYPRLWLYLFMSTNLYLKRFEIYPSAWPCWSAKSLSITFW